ncbi:predicted protein [Lichtheimia corymbifera JMRC:FSU:9682]|uniref:Secreted protein n=1 Tax=Lichtheimia corymbifera JMRC:FSU:9682 TaxID=1263082 RepID=A0A068S701_9FUNG|nr:predicted protein [Lichtheimia corymbifera JMRC:FSU:9682]
MKLARIFGVALMIVAHAVYAAQPGTPATENTCKGKMPTSTVKQCEGKPCTFEFGVRMKDNEDTDVVATRSCVTPPAGVDCSKFRKNVNECLEHQCSYVGYYRGSNEGHLVTLQEHECVSEVPDGLELQPPTSLVPPK